MSRMRAAQRRRAFLALLASVVVAATGVAACDSRSGTVPLPVPSPAPTGPGAKPDRPNIVFVLTDDLAWNLVKYMPHVLALQQSGMTFTSYTVTDSLCCPSRASILTGQFPHDTHVISNDSPSGGFARFRDQGDESHTFATSLKAAGYRTALVGKYLNHYDPATKKSSLLPPIAYVPPGWTTWGGVDGHGYDEYGYAMAHNHAVTQYGHQPADYLTHVITGLGEQFITSSASARTPFLLELSTFAPHAPATPAPADAGTFAGLRAPRTPAFDRVPRGAPAWLAHHAALTSREVRAIDRAFERRVEAVQAVDRMIGALQTTLRRSGQSRNTVFVFSSDNGYHMGEYTLRPGKQTAFDTDVRVPLVVSGPGIPAGSTNDAIVENIDLAPTFDDLTGAATPAEVDGRSIVPLLHRTTVPWRSVAGIEHHKPAYMVGDPDRQTKYQGVPPSYDAIRTARYTYVRYLDGEREYYDRTRDPNELHNIVGRLSEARRAELNRMVDRLTSCHGQASCWAAGRPGTT